MEPIITSEQTFLLWGVLIALTAFTIWGEDNLSLIRKASGTISIIVLGAILSNVGFIPISSPVYDHVWGRLVPLAIPLLLIHADLRHIIRESGQVLIAFLLGAVGSLLGALAGYALFVLPDPAEKIVSTLTASYIGGSMNFAAVATATGISGDPMLVPTLAADNLVAVVYLVILGYIPGTLIIRKYFGDLRTADAPATPEAAPLSIWSDIAPLHALAALAVAWGIVLIGDVMRALTGLPGTDIITITVLSVAIASSFGAQLRQLRGVFQLGMVIMYIFFATIGASANVWILLESAPIIIMFLITLVLVHFLFTFTLGRMLGIGLPELITGSNACVLGPTTAAGLAASKGWEDLVTPAILAGVLGYAIANFIGIGLYGFLS